MKQYKIYHFILFDYTYRVVLYYYYLKQFSRLRGVWRLAFGVNVNSLYYHHQHPRLPLPLPLPVVPLPLPRQ